MRRPGPRTVVPRRLGARARIIGMVLAIGLVGGLAACGTQAVSTEDLPSLDEIVDRANTAWESHPTLHAEGRLWTHTERSIEASRRAVKRLEEQTAGSGALVGTISPVAVGSDGSSGPPPETTEVIQRLWREPSRTRVDSGDGSERSSRVRDGARTLTVDPNTGAITEPWNADDVGASDVDLEKREATIDPIFAFGIDRSLEIELVGGEVIAGRTAAVLLGRPTTTLVAPLDREPSSFRFVTGEEIELAIDVETGLVLRREEWVDGEPFSRWEVTTLEVGVPAAPGTFSVEPPPGVPVYSGEDLQPKEMSLADAARSMPFTLWAEPGIEADSTVTTTAFPGFASVHFEPDGSAGPDDFRTIVERAAPSDPTHGIGSLSDPTPRTVIRDGIEFTVTEERGSATITFVREGTLIQMGGGDADSLIDAGLGLRPVPR